MNEEDRIGRFYEMSDLVDRFMSIYKLSDKWLEHKVLQQWGELMGLAVANRTTNLYIKDKVLIVELNSSVMRDELMFGKQIILERINKAAGKTIIEDIWFS